MHFQALPERVTEIRQKVGAAVARGGHGQTVRIVAVTKTHGPEAVTAAMSAGLHEIGENKVQEAIGKQDVLGAAGAGATWHLIGHLQRNKVKFLDRFALFHAVDSTRLADAIDEFGRKKGSAIDVLLEANVSGEASKGGFSLDEVKREAERLAAMNGIRVHGVMTMAPFDADEATLRRVFGGAREAREICRRAGHDASELSMGMSGDFEVAVEEGATMVRLGTVLFGERTP
jgi:pyridoxal phosphate enzyme (YggS family)